MLYSRLYKFGIKIISGFKWKTHQMATLANKGKAISVILETAVCRDGQKLPGLSDSLKFP